MSRWPSFSRSIWKLALKILRNISNRLRYTKERLQRLHARKVSTLTKEEIEDAFWKLSPSSFNAHIRRVRSVLAFGVKHGYLSTNPAVAGRTDQTPATVRQNSAGADGRVDAANRAKQHRGGLALSLCFALHRCKAGGNFQVALERLQH